MSSKGVIVVVSGEDKSGEVFAAVKKHFDETQAAAKKTSDSLGDIGKSLMHGLEAAGIAVGIKEVISQLHQAVSDAAEFGESIAKAGERTGIAAGSLSVLHYAAAVTSTDFDKLVTASGRMGKNLADAADGNKKLSAAFQKIGVTARDVVGRHDALDIVLQHLGKTLAETESPARRLQIAGDLLGKSGQAQIPVLIDLAEHFGDLKKKAQAAGVYLDDMSANQLQALNAKMKDMEQRVLGAKVAFADGLTPSLNGIIEAFTTASNGTNIWNSAGKQAGLTAIEAAGAFNFFGQNIRQMVDEIRGLYAELDYVTNRIDAATSVGADARARASARRDAAKQELDAAIADHKLSEAEEQRFHDALLKLKNDLEHSTASAGTPAGGGNHGDGGGGNHGNASGGNHGSGEAAAAAAGLPYEQSALHAHFEAMRAGIREDEAENAALAKIADDALWAKMAESPMGIFPKAPTAKLGAQEPAAPKPADVSKIEGESEKFAHGLFDPLFNLGEKWSQQWKQIRANMLRDIGQAAEGQLFGALFGDSSGSGGKGLDGSKGHKGVEGAGGLVGDGLSKLDGLFHKKTSTVSNGTGTAGAGTVLSAAASALQVGKATGSGSGGIQVILNNTGTPQQVDSTQFSSGQGNFESGQIQIFLKDLETNGPMRQGITSLFS